MKTFSTSGTGSQQSLSEIENNKIPVYDTKTDAESDLANLTVGQIIATKDEGNETSTPVDVVQDGNMHAVTSNAVANVLDWKYAIVSCEGGASGSLAVPTSYNGNYEYSIYDYKYHITFHGIHINVEGNVQLGCIATNYAGISNDYVVLQNNAIGYLRESTAGDYRIAYRPLPSATVLS